MTHIKTSQKEVNYTIDESRSNPWSWREFIAAIDDTEKSKASSREKLNHEMSDLEMVVTGPRGDAQGITEISIEADNNSYDHKRATRMEDQCRSNIQLRIWNFVVFRNDGSSCRLHPDFAQNSISYREGRSSALPTRPPRTGLGGTEGPGTYKHYKIEGVDKLMRFDAGKFS